MSDFLEMIIIGLVQGLTEFLPVSSSGHLVIFGDLLGIQETGIALEVFVHFGTLLAVCICFHMEFFALIKAIPHLPQHLLKKLPNNNDDERFRSMAIYILISMFPAGIIGVFCKAYLEQFYHNLYVVFICLIITGFILLSLRWSKKRPKKDFMSGRDSLLIGLGQAFAILPGISRSGTTISIGEALGLKSELAAKFSFLMSIPVIAGATLLEVKDMLKEDISSQQTALYATAMVTAAISGIFAIKFLMALIKKQKMEYFAYYCFAVAIIGMALKA